MGLHETAHRNYERRDRGQGTIAEHIVKDCFEFRHDKDEQESHDRDCHCHDDERVDHGGGDFVFDLSGFFLKLRKPGKNKLEHTAHFAGLYHVDVKVIKDERILRETFRKGAAALN